MWPHAGRPPPYTVIHRISTFAWCTNNTVRHLPACCHRLQVKAKTTRNALYEQEEVKDADTESDHDRSYSSKKTRQGKSRDEDGSHASRRSKDGSGKKSKAKEKRKTAKNRDASSDEEEAVQGLQLTNIMQIMEQQQR